MHSTSLQANTKILIIQFSMRLPEQPLRLPHTPDSVLSSGITGYIRGMFAFPVLREWEIQTALSEHRKGGTLDGLREKTPFRQWLKMEGYDLPTPPFKGSFTKLFAESSDILHLVAVGIFPTVVTLVRQWTSASARLNVPLEEFFQDALAEHIPYSAAKYTPVEGVTFRNYAMNLLKRRFVRFVDTHERQTTTPGGYRQGSKGAPKEVGRRRAVESLQRALPNSGAEDFDTPSGSGTPHARTLLDLVDGTAHPFGEEDTEKLALYSAVADLARRANLSTLEGTVLIGLFVDQFSIEEVALVLRTDIPKVRGARHRAMERLRKLDEAEVAAILAGEHVPMSRRGRDGEVA